MSLPGWQKFETRAPGKWVLAGEHAVLRGVPAIALPHPELALKLKYEPAGASLGNTLAIEPADADKPVREILAEAAKRFAVPQDGRLAIESSIPFGAGLGSSAALCVAITRWLLKGQESVLDGKDVVASPLKLAEFATRLEDRFHGKSSGMDVAVIAAEAPVRYVRGQGTAPLFADPGRARIPRFTFHDTGLRASTRDCIARVEALAQLRPSDARQFDKQMHEASNAAEQGLKLYANGSDADGLAQVARAMDLSHHCFVGWDLVPSQALELRQNLLSQGARAVKLTGAGRGGMLVALW